MLENRAARDLNKEDVEELAAVFSKIEQGGTVLFMSELERFYQVNNSFSLAADRQLVR